MRLLEYGVELHHLVNVSPFSGYSECNIYYYFVAVICPDLTLTNGIVVYSDNNIPRLEGAMATYTCTTGYQVTGLMVRTCTATGWSTGDDPVCTGEGDVCICANSVDCKTPTAICPVLTLSNGGINYNPDTSPILEGAMATHSCVTGYQLSSSTTTRTCQSDRMWSGDDITCQGTCRLSIIILRYHNY